MSAIPPTPSTLAAAGIRLAAFGPADYDAACALWQRTPGVGLSSADERPAILRYLERNPGLSLTAWRDTDLVGTMLCGHDGRRGLIHHLAVDTRVRRQGLGQALVQTGMAALRACGIEKCHLMVFADNAEGRAFWEVSGAHERAELRLYSLAT